MGADGFGKKELVAVQDSFRDCEHSWTEVLLDLKRRGLKEGPKLSIGDGSMGFWIAMAKVYSETE